MAAINRAAVGSLGSERRPASRRDKHHVGGALPDPRTIQIARTEPCQACEPEQLDAAPFFHWFDYAMARIQQGKLPHRRQQWDVNIHWDDQRGEAEDADSRAEYTFSSNAIPRPRPSRAQLPPCNEGDRVTTSEDRIVSKS